VGKKKKAVKRADPLHRKRRERKKKCQPDRPHIPTTYHSLSPTKRGGEGGEGTSWGGRGGEGLKRGRAFPVSFFFRVQDEQAIREKKKRKGGRSPNSKGGFPYPAGATG